MTLRYWKWDRALLLLASREPTAMLWTTCVLGAASVDKGVSPAEEGKLLAMSFGDLELWMRSLNFLVKPQAEGSVKPC